MKCFSKTISPEYTHCRTINDFIAAGIGEEIIVDIFQDFDRTKNAFGKTFR